MLMPLPNTNPAPRHDRIRDDGRPLPGGHGAVRAARRVRARSGPQTQRRHGGPRVRRPVAARFWPRDLRRLPVRDRRRCVRRRLAGWHLERKPLHSRLLGQPGQGGLAVLKLLLTRDQISQAAVKSVLFEGLMTCDPHHSPDERPKFAFVLGPHLGLFDEEAAGRLSGIVCEPGGSARPYRQKAERGRGDHDGSVPRLTWTGCSVRYVRPETLRARAGGHWCGAHRSVPSEFQRFSPRPRSEVNGNPKSQRTVPVALVIGEDLGRTERIHGVVGGVGPRHGATGPRAQNALGLMDTRGHGVSGGVVTATSGRRARPSVMSADTGLYPVMLLAIPIVLDRANCTRWGSLSASGVECPNPNRPLPCRINSA